MISCLLVPKFQESKVSRRPSGRSNSHFPKCIRLRLPYWKFLVLKVTLQKLQREEAVCINQPPIEQMFFERQLHRSFLLSAADTMEAKLPSISVVMDISNSVAGIELEACEKGSVTVNTYKSGQGWGEGVPWVCVYQAGHCRSPHSWSWGPLWRKPIWNFLWHLMLHPASEDSLLTFLCSYPPIRKSRLKLCSSWVSIVAILFLELNQLAYCAHCAMTSFSLHVQWKTAEPGHLNLG